MDITFKSITIRNFLSFGNAPTTLKLDRPGTTFVIGKDLDSTASGEGGNGVGKTTILNALVFAIYDKPLSEDIAKTGLVNWVNNKEMEVTIEFTKGNTEYAIRRTRKGKSGASVYLHENKADITPDSIANTDREIERIIGMPYNLFIRVVSYSATNKPFLALPQKSTTNPANQKDIIEELFDLKTITIRANTLKEQIKITNQDIKMQQAKIDQHENEKDRHNTQVSNAKARIQKWEDDTEKEIYIIRKKMDSVKDIDIDEERKWHDSLNEINTNLKDYLTKQKKLEENITRNIRKIKDAKKTLKELKKSTCPFCHQEYKDTKSKIQEYTTILNDAQKAVENDGDLLGDVDEKVENLQKQQVAVKGKITVTNLKELIAISGQQEQMMMRLVDLEKAINPHIDSLTELEEIKIADIDTDGMNELHHLLEHQKFMLNLLSNKDSFIRKKLLNKHIPYLNQKLAKYLTALGLSHNVSFTKEMTVAISKFGRTLGFGNFSNGQKARVNLAVSLAFRDMLEDMHDVTINIFMLDEVLDVGLDTIGVHAAAKLLKGKGRDDGLSVYIISHREEINSAFDNKITVTMKKGFSYIEEA